MNEVVISLTQENDGLIQEVKELKSRLNAQIGGPVQMVDNKAAIEEVSLELNWQIDALSQQNEGLITEVGELKMEMLKTTEEATH